MWLFLVLSVSRGIGCHPAPPTHTVPTPQHTHMYIYFFMHSFSNVRADDNESQGNLRNVLKMAKLPWAWVPERLCGGNKSADLFTCPVQLQHQQEMYFCGIWASMYFLGLLIIAINPPYLIQEKKSMCPNNSTLWAEVWEKGSSQGSKPEWFCSESLELGTAS